MELRTISAYQTDAEACFGTAAEKRRQRVEILARRLPQPVKLCGAASL